MSDVLTQYRDKRLKSSIVGKSREWEIHCLTVVLLPYLSQSS